jgi:cob(I)alamin adenosyltransferase
MKIYTKQGDSGGTGLVGGQRVAKDDVRIEAYGTVDELSAALGTVCAQSVSESLVELLQALQRDLFVIGAQLATPAPQAAPAGEVDAGDVQRLEQAIDRYEIQLPPLRHFILPGGSPVAASLHMARVICRRAERRVVTLARQTDVGEQLVPYLNRLGDLLFVLARAANAAAGVADIPWHPQDKSEA